jgi:NAD(P)-dependent dehydrogenase (short-subunit alcohol dehydrogenase family)
VQAASGPIDHRAGCHALVQELLQAHGRIDFLIHNAGWVEYQMLEAIEDEALEQMLCLVGRRRCGWRRRRGRRCARPAVAASSSRHPIARCIRSTHSAGCPRYAMGKLAALGLVNVLALEGAEHGIVVNAVSPVAKTRMWGIEGEPDELHPEAVAQGVAYLASTRCQEGGGHCVPATGSSMHCACRTPSMWRTRGICAR